MIPQPTVCCLPTNLVATNTPSEILQPELFGMVRYVHFASRLTGWNAIKSRVEQLGLTMTDEQVKSVYVILRRK